MNFWLLFLYALKRELALGFWGHQFYDGGGDCCCCGISRRRFCAGSGGEEVMRVKPEV